jgi:hypothetical protein
MPQIPNEYDTSPTIAERLSALAERMSGIPKRAPRRIANPYGDQVVHAVENLVDPPGTIQVGTQSFPAFGR